MPAKNYKKNKQRLKKSTYFRRFFCIFFTCINLLVIGLIVILKHWAIDYYSVSDALRHIFPGILFLGTFAWLAGLILDNPKKNLVIEYKDLIYEELIRANAKITPEELERKLQIVTKELPPEEEEENFAFEDADFDLGESKIEL